MRIDTAVVNEQRSDPRHERAWWILLGASLCVFSNSAPVAFYTFGVFLPEIIAQTHWSAQLVAAAIGPGLLAAAATALLAGRACDRFGIRRIILAGAPLAAIGLALVGLAPRSAAQFTAAIVLMFLLYFVGTPVPYAKLLSGWFDRRRGLALSMMFASSSIGIAFWPPFAAFLIQRMGWRGAYVALGLTAASLILIAALFLLKDPPTSRPSTIEKHGEEPGLVLSQALRTAKFWKISFIFFLLTGVLGGTAAIFPFVLRTQGADPTTAASIMSAVGGFMFLGRLSLSITLDRFFAPYVTVWITAVSMVAFVIMMIVTTLPALFVAAAFLGFGLGCEYAVTAYMVSRAFGLRSFGSIYGLITLLTTLGAALGASLLGSALVSSIGIATLAGVALAALSPAILLLITLRRADLPYRN
ncbi:MFS transporter [Rhizorhabdus sp.]|uniref:MFS transporter n=1 Tax=Rhizorhabdus sp. TaxID=1968843 RepID=UPI0019C03CE4|nr:MFS transporter [Rhizorhabdus sp.]MBD3759315.1 MFS transporter [Rhizorhabdus sp.]